MKPMTTSQAKIFAAKFARGAFSYYNYLKQANMTVAYYRGENPLMIENDAAPILAKVELTETTNYILKVVPMLTIDQLEIIANKIREMLR